MNNTPAQSDSHQRFEHILSALSKYRMLWIAPAVIGMVLSLVYVIALRQETWSAKQSLIVRDDLLGQSFKPGRFDSIESMKSAQETILEIARKPQVIRNALEQLGPESTGMFGLGGSDWPSEETIESVQGAISFVAPNGAEFGKTEVIVLNTKASTRERSRKFIELLLDEIIVKVDEVRSLRLQSMEAELTQARNAAVAALDKSKAKLQEMDQILGTDFGSMASLDDGPSGGNTIKGDISQIQTEKRQTELQLERRKSSLAELMKAKDNPNRILGISADLIAMHPSLDDLKKALITTQGELAAMDGLYEPLHPQHLKAANSIVAMKRQMYLELDPCIAGLRSDIALLETSLQRLNAKTESLNSRLYNLGSNRANSMTLLAEWKQRSEIANTAESDLAEIRGLATARNAELITRVDEPQVSTRPDGLGKKATVLACGFGGLMLGLGLVLLVAPPMGEEQNQSNARRTAANSASNQAPLTESIFDAKNFEKVIVAAATAASTAVQTASKAKQYFMTPKSDAAESDGEGFQESGFTFERENSVEKNEHASNRSSTDDATQSPPGTPSVNDLLDAAKSISKPAPVASQPLSSSSRITIRPAEQNPKANKSTAQPVLPAPKPIEPAPQSVQPAPQSVQPTMQPVQPAPQPVAETPTRITPPVDVSMKEVAAKPASELAAIQLAALRGTRIEPAAAVPPLPASNDATVDVPNQAEEMPPVEPIPVQRASTQHAPEIREEPQTIVLSEMSPGMSAQFDPEHSSVDNVSKLTRRDPNVRPVDLAKSAQEEDSTFVRINTSSPESNSTDHAAEPSHSDVSDKLERAPGNPFLGDRVSKSATDRENFSDEDSNSMAVPDQIQKLSDTISKFASPAKPDEQGS